MPLALIGLLTMILFGSAFRYYGNFIAQKFLLSSSAKTPAVKHNDGNDFIPTKKAILIAQHFASIAAAGPIVGPITAAIYFGWGPAWLWIVLGSIFIGAIHDFSSLVASVKHDAKSIPELAKKYIGPKAYALVLGFIWFSLLYVIIAFTSVTAQAFLAKEIWDSVAHNIGGGVATSSFLYLGLSMLMGVALYKWKTPLWLATILFFPALLGIILLGQYIPIQFNVSDPALLWGVIILVYCAIASVLPMWLLLQPRGYLGGYFLYVVLIFGVLGILFGGYHAQYPLMLSWYSPQIGSLFPFLFITIACGACSGFHGLVCSGTTSKQLHKETHATSVGYGGMLLEGIVAVMALATVMMWPQGSPMLSKSPAEVYANGIAYFMHSIIGLPISAGLTFGMLAFATFVYDTLDVATRLGRYLMEELLNIRGAAGRWIATLLTLGIPMAYLFLGSNLQSALHSTKPIWLTIWPLFGSSNQLLAALTFLMLAAWFKNNTKSKKQLAPWLVLPAFFMFITTMVALGLQCYDNFLKLGAGNNPIALINFILSLALITISILFLGQWFSKMHKK